MASSLSKIYTSIPHKPTEMIVDVSLTVIQFVVPQIQPIKILVSCNVMVKNFSQEDHAKPNAIVQLKSPTFVQQIIKPTIINVKWNVME